MRFFTGIFVVIIVIIIIVVIVIIIVIVVVIVIVIKEGRQGRYCPPPREVDPHPRLFWHAAADSAHLTRYHRWREPACGSLYCHQAASCHTTTDIFAACHIIACRLHLRLACTPPSLHPMSTRASGVVLVQDCGTQGNL